MHTIKVQKNTLHYITSTQMRTQEETDFEIKAYEDESRFSERGY